MTINQILKNVYALGPLMESTEPVTLRRDHLGCLKTFPMTQKPDRYIEQIMYLGGLFPRCANVKIGTPYFFLENAHGYLLSESDLMLLNPDIHGKKSPFTVYMLRIDADPERGHTLRLWKMSPIKRLVTDQNGYMYIKQPEKKGEADE